MGALTRLTLLAAPLLLGRTLRAQSAPPPRTWSGQAELSGSVFFGNQPQTLVTTRESLGRADSTLELRAEVRFIYGEATLDGRDAVTRRAWLTSLNADLRPHARSSPFLIAGWETSLERRLRSRTNAGLGHKVTFHRTERALLDVSLALLAERSAELDADDVVRVRRIGRWSSRVRARRTMGERVALTHETFYRPEAREPSQFTVSSSTAANVRLTRRTSVALTLLDNYDSRARERGARVNNDGSLVAGLRAEF